MELTDVRFDQRVADEHGNEGIVIDIQKGWVTVEMGDEDKKFRAKDITAVGQKEGDGEVLEATADFTKDLIPDGEPRDIKCPHCKEEFNSTSGYNVKCPGCKKVLFVKLFPNKDNYTTGLSETASGRDTMDINDDVASKLRGMDQGTCVEFTADLIESIGPDIALTKKDAVVYKTFNGSVEDFLWEKYGHLNPGMVRMNCGNLLRGSLKRQEKAEAVKAVKAEAKK